MSHHVYISHGFVIDSKPNGEAGKILFLFTRELGLVAVVAQGIRLGISKLRYHVQDFSYAEFSLVKGKEMWRLTGVTPSFDLDDYLAGDERDFYLNLRARVFSLLKRVLHGEEKNEPLFDSIICFFRYLSDLKKEADGSKREIPDHKEADTDLIECIIVLRILNHLGYIRSSDILTSFFANDNWNDELITAMRRNKAFVVREINSALKASQL